MIEASQLSTAGSPGAAFYPSLKTPPSPPQPCRGSPKPKSGPSLPSRLTPTPPPLLPQPQQKKRIRPKKPVSTLQNDELTTMAAGERLMSPYGDPFEASVLATWLMICWISTTRMWILRATSGRNSLTKFSIGAVARLIPYRSALEGKLVRWPGT